MDLSEAIKGRRSVRAYKKQDVPQEAIEKLLEAATWAPSAGNLQPWQFVVVRAQAVKAKLSKAALNQKDVEEAPVVIVVCADEQRSSARYGLRGKTLYCIQDTAAAVQNLLLTAYSYGLGSCWIGAFDEDAVKAAVKAPEGVRPVAIVLVGYADESPKPPSRRRLDQVVHHESY
ncbi:MAG: nitroreductase family protein [Candidatus Bathyarchaeota archaeon]|nr:nitroreductase family protein [Candidatus Bathyarchaeota archaeon]